MNRSVAGLKIDKDARLCKWWGDSTWAELLTKRGFLRAQHVCDRFRTELKYKHAYPFPIYEEKDKGGRVMYYMIHASDHDEAAVLMNRAYGKALDIQESVEQLEFLKDCSTKLAGLGEPTAS
ncbi:MAG TPA: hypothetical protein VNZ64_04540 [Candidatus Acidoferrum sp.]|jgi:hypothetical protein|nr:hypothetical protein [Candidatus Acidoferrum sp.]